MSAELDTPLENEEGDLLRALVERGCVIESEVERARESQLRDERKDVYRPLVDYLVDAACVTPAQIARARRELEDTEVVGDLPGYRLLETLGRGSMGTVHRGRQICLEREVAVKLLSRRLARNRHYVESFGRECQLAALAGGQFFPQVFDAGYARGQHFLVMEFVAGTSVGAKIAAGPMSTAETLDVAIEVCAALDHLHRLGVVHRDVKPQNIVLGPHRRLKLLDLGLARRLDDELQLENERGAAIGTPHYISPEQVSGGKTLDGRSDIYSLGASMYHMLTGRRLFERDSTSEVFGSHLKDRPVPPRTHQPLIPPSVEAVVLRMLEKNPDHRYSSADALREQLLALREALQASEATEHFDEPIAPPAAPPSSLHSSASPRLTPAPRSAGGPLSHAAAMANAPLSDPKISNVSAHDSEQPISTTILGDGTIATSSSISSLPAHVLSPRPLGFEGFTQPITSVNAPRGAAESIRPLSGGIRLPPDASQEAPPDAGSHPAAPPPSGIHSSQAGLHTQTAGLHTPPSGVHPPSPSGVHPPSPSGLHPPSPSGLHPPSPSGLHAPPSGLHAPSAGSQPPPSDAELDAAAIQVVANLHTPAPLSRFRVPEPTASLDQALSLVTDSASIHSPFPAMPQPRAGALKTPPETSPVEPAPPTFEALSALVHAGLVDLPQADVATAEAGSAEGESSSIEIAGAGLDAVDLHDGGLIDPALPPPGAEEGFNVTAYAEAGVEASPLDALLSGGPIAEADPELLGGVGDGREYAPFLPQSAGPDSFSGLRADHEPLTPESFHATPASPASSAEASPPPPFLDAPPSDAPSSMQGPIVSEDSYDGDVLAAEVGAIGPRIDHLPPTLPDVASDSAPPDHPAAAEDSVSARRPGSRSFFRGFPGFPGKKE